MALKLYERYPQLWESPSNDYPQGAFKNLSAQGETDGSYLEKDWLNDYSGFFGALLKNAQMTPNGTIDTAQRSQFYDALIKIAKGAVADQGYATKTYVDNKFNEVPKTEIINDWDQASDENVFSAGFYKKYVDVVWISATNIVNPSSKDVEDFIKNTSGDVGIDLNLELVEPVIIKDVVESKTIFFKGVISWKSGTDLGSSSLITLENNVDLTLVKPYLEGNKENTVTSVTGAVQHGIHIKDNIGTITLDSPECNKFKGTGIAINYPLTVVKDAECHNNDWHGVGLSFDTAGVAQLHNGNYSGNGQYGIDFSRCEAVNTGHLVCTGNSAGGYKTSTNCRYINLENVSLVRNKGISVRTTGSQPNLKASVNTLDIIVDETSEQAISIASANVYTINTINLLVGGEPTSSNPHIRLGGFEVFKCGMIYCDRTNRSLLYATGTKANSVSIGSIIGGDLNSYAVLNDGCDVDINLLKIDSYVGATFLISAQKECSTNIGKIVLKSKDAPVLRVIGSAIAVIGCVFTNEELKSEDFNVSAGSKIYFKGVAPYTFAGRVTEQASSDIVNLPIDLPDLGQGTMYLVEVSPTNTTASSQVFSVVNKHAKNIRLRYASSISGEVTYDVLVRIIAKL